MTARLTREYRRAERERTLHRKALRRLKYGALESAR